MPASRYRLKFTAGIHRIVCQDYHWHLSRVFTHADPETLVFHITSTSDLMATSVGDSNNHNLLVLAKAPTGAVAIDAEGTWWVVQLETPNQLTLQRNGSGKVTGVSGANSFRQSRRPLVISAPGRYNYNSGEEEGAVAVAPDGTVTLTADDPQEPVHQLHMNTLKDVMISSSSSSGDGQLLVLVKIHEVRNWEAAGRWSLHTLNLPAALTLARNAENLVTDIGGLNSFRNANGWVRFQLDGGLTGFLEDAFRGFTTGSSNGLLTIDHDEPPAFVGAINAGGNFLAGVEGGTAGNDLSMLLAVRSVRPLEAAALPGTTPKIVWVPGPDRALLEGTTLLGWEVVPGSTSGSCYLPISAGDGPTHFYQLVSPPPPAP